MTPSRDFVYSTCIVLGFGALLFYGLGRWDALNAQHDRALDQQTARALADSRHLIEVRYAEVRKASAEADRKLVALAAVREREKVLADSATKLVGAARRAIEEARTAGDSLRIYPRLAAQLTLRGDHLEEALNLALARDSLLAEDRDRWKELADDAQPVIESLTLALTAEHRARSCRILGFIACPSRKIIAAVAGIVGVVAGAAVAN